MADELGLRPSLPKHRRHSANFVLAIQKEMFHDHFFFDKMLRVELEPLAPEQMLDAYKQRFKSTEPFTEEVCLRLRGSVVEFSGASSDTLQ